MPKISQLESATDVTANDLIQIVDVEDGGMAPSGTNKKTTASLLANQLVPLISDNTIAGSKIADSGITSAKIANGTIVDADINASAAIAGTKVSPNFGSQSIVTTGLINNITIGRGSGNLASNTASGLEALYSNTTGINNTASGRNALYSNTTGINNTASGRNALYSNTTGDSNTASGRDALFGNTTGNFNTASGVNALFSNTTNSNVTGLGYDAQVTGGNQVQLGDSSTTTYAYGSVQDRSDIRDKADIRDTQLGLDFISSLRPVDFRWDMREDYRTPPPEVVEKPQDLKEDATEEEKTTYAEELAAYDAYLVVKDAWLESVKLANITHDGSKKRNRYHHGLIAQEVKSVIDEMGVDFGGFQNHSFNGGDDVLSIGYAELIAPLIKAIQELKARVEELESAP